MSELFILLTIVDAALAIGSLYYLDKKISEAGKRISILNFPVDTFLKASDLLKSCPTEDYDRIVWARNTFVVSSVLLPIFALQFWEL